LLLYAFAKPPLVENRLLACGFGTRGMVIFISFLAFKKPPPEL